jgi:hypothetical protein
MTLYETRKSLPVNKFRFVCFINIIVIITLTNHNLNSLFILNNLIMKNFTPTLVSSCGNAT